MRKRHTWAFDRVSVWVDWHRDCSFYGIYNIFAAAAVGCIAK